MSSFWPGIQVPGGDARAELALMWWDGIPASVGEDRGRDSVEEVYRLKLLAYRGFVLLLVGLLVASTVWISLAAADADWTSKDIDSATITCCPSVTETPSGVLKIAFGTTEGLVCAAETPDGWSISPVMMLEDHAGMVAVHEVVIACDEDGWAHIASVSYWDDGEDGDWFLVHSLETSSGWQNTIVDDCLYPNPVSMSVDSNSRAHIAYSKWWSDWRVMANLSYATDASGSWVCNPDVLGGSRRVNTIGLAPSIALDSQNQPHVAFLMEFSLEYVTNLSGEPKIDTLAVGDPMAASSVYSSAPSIMVDSEDTVHVFYFHEYVESYASPISIIRTVNHCTITDGIKSHENFTRSSNYDHSYSVTKACVDDSGTYWIFHGGGDVGVIKLSEDGGLEERMLVHYRDVDGPIYYGSSAVIRAGGEMVIAKPCGTMGYFTDSVSLAYRLSTGIDSIDTSGKVVLSVVIISIAAAAVFSGRALSKEKTWHDAFSGQSKTDDV
ncbi:TPA: hypothetical protein HA259_06925 [Thermoplasmata archaeon]|nr:hypothetical protein [Thermoplasmata archaeon]